jgi:hypothetical protein
MFYIFEDFFSGFMSRVCPLRLSFLSSTVSLTDIYSKIGLFWREVKKELK